jgi:hypothetical protein
MATERIHNGRIAIRLISSVFLGCVICLVIPVGSPDRDLSYDAGKRVQVAWSTKKLTGFYLETQHLPAIVRA